MVLLQRQAVKQVDTASHETEHHNGVHDGDKTQVDPDEEVAPPPEVLGDTVPLTPEGFQAVMDAPCGYEKELFVGRVVKDLGFDVKNETALHEWMTVVYKEAHTLPGLRALISRASEDGTCPWLSPMPISLMTLEKPVRKPVRRKPSKVNMIESKEQGIGKSMSGKTAPLNERGYKGVAKLRSQKQMEIFVRRLVANQGLYVVDEGALRGMVPYYSGAKATQSFKALTTEIEKAEKKKKNSWVSSTYKPLKEPPPKLEEEEEAEPEARPSLSDLVVKPKKNNEKKKEKGRIGADSAH